MEKENREFEAREKLQKLSQVVTAYKGGYEKIHDARRRDLYAELLSQFREGKAPELILRTVGRLCALEDIDQEFRNYINDSRKYEKRLEEIENERREENERENFHQYHGV